MSELRAAPVLLRAPAPLVATAAGAGVATVTAASLLHPDLGLYLTQAAQLVTGLCACGLALFAVFVGPGPAGRETARAAAVLTLVAFAAGLLHVAFAVMTVAGDGVRGLGDSLARAVVLRSGEYQSVVVRSLGLVALAIGLVGPVGARTRRLLATAGPVVVAGSFALTGHPRTDTPGALAWGLTVVHVLAAGAWFGGLVGLAVRLRSNRSDPDGTARALARFARLMTGVLTALLAGGVGLALLEVTSWTALLHTAFGQVLLVKLAVVAGLLVVSSANHRHLVPAARRGDTTAVQVLRTNIAVEQIALVAVLLITAVLGHQSPGG